ncbi:MAG: amino acid adenylation domain-containing protein [Candidatus Aminicenantes bacterium]|nr:amino acid adenylation domain-containing protein [Candidatus Aminicenantes bacterium]
MEKILAGLNDIGVKQFEEEMPILNLHTDYPRSLMQSYEANRVKFELGREETLLLSTLATEQGITQYIILLAVCSIWLTKLSGQEDIVIGIPIAGRGHDVPHDLIGMFENTLALRNFPAAEKTVTDFLKEVNERTLAAFQEQDYAFADTLEKFALHKDVSRNPLFDLNLEFFENNDRLVFSLQYSTKLFKEETARRFAGYFKNIINSITGNPRIRISAVEMMGKEEKQRMLEIATGIIEPCDLHETVHGMFEKAASENEAKIALVFRGSHMSYGKLNRASNQLARILRNKGVGPDWVVGLMAERSFHLVIGVLGILKAGGAFLPIDPKFPGQRKRYMLQDGNVKILLTCAETTGETLYNSSNIEQVDITDDTIYRGNAENLANINKGSDLLYVIFTSGSTGRPKGVMLAHTNLVNLITFHYKHTDINCGKVLQFVTMSFDVSYQEIFAALLAGGELYLIVEETRVNIPVLFDIIGKNKIKTLFLPMSFLKMIFSQEGYIARFPASVGHIVTAGEQAVVNERFGKYLKENNIYFYNHYGPSETHVITTFTMYPWQDTLEFPPIGKPIMNTIIYILDIGGHLQPVEVTGELVAGGLQVGRGYMNNVQLTSEKFIMPSATRNPFEKGFLDFPKLLFIHHSPCYRTGDLARWLSDGNIEFLGRVDQQVKIRGFRVELGEIENELVKHKDIKDAVVIPGEDETGDKYLCVYYVPHHPNIVKVEELTAYLSRFLPGYMIPLHFLALEKIPLTASGKVDRKALPRPGQLEAGSIYVAPGNKTQEKLAELWSQVLGVRQEKIGIDDHFFQVGGQSLKAAMLISKIHSTFNVSLPLVEFFESPTIRAQARYIKEAELTRYAPIEAVEKKEYYDLSPAQKRLFIMHQMEAPYNMGNAWEIKGRLDKNRLAATFQQLIHRHESLRTSFLTVENEPAQKIYSDVDFKIEVYDLGGGDQGVKISAFFRPFDLSCAPLLRAGLIRTGENEHIFMVDIHHIVSDGLSLGIFIKEFMALYQGRGLPPLRLQYKDYCQWWKQQQQQRILEKQEEYWLKLFETEIPVLELPYDYPRPSLQGFEGRTIFFHLDVEETGALKRFVSGEKNAPTLYMALLALFNILLAKLSGNEDIAVGTPVHGRKHMDLHSIIGMFVGTLAMRFFPVPEKTIAQFIREVKELSLAAFENQDHPFEELVEKVLENRDRGRNPLFDVMFAVQDSEIFPGFELEGLSVKPYKHDSGTSYFDLFWEVIEGGGALTFALNYCAKLFKEETLKRFFTYFKKIVYAAIENPLGKIGEIEIITGEEKRAILYDFNDTQAGYPRDKTIHRIFQEQVERAPDHIAIIGAALSLCGCPVSVTYRQLNEQSGRLAWMLIAKGVLLGEIIGIKMERSIEKIMGILGILKTGGAYLSLDPAYPRERIDYMLKESAAKILLTAADCAFNFHHSSFDLPRIHHSSHLAYIIYTSGSTGRPKGVMVEHRNVIRLVKNTNYVEFKENDRLLQTGALEFDASTFEIWGSLLNGMTLVILAKDDILDPERLKSIIWRHDICTMWLTSPLFNRMVQWDVDIFAGLRNLLVGGDMLSPSHIGRVRNRFPGLKIINGYGPTENTTFSTTYRIDKQNTNRIPIGKPIANSTAYILNRTNRVTPVGVAGELCVGGDGVSRGYLNNPELTREKFIDFHHSSFDLPRIHHSKLYRTGDLARWLVDGNIEFLGRIDQQVKIRGFRVELGEIENELINHKGLKEAMVIPLEDGTGDKYLCAYYVPSHPNSLNGEELTAYLSRFLPGYMVPLHFLAIEKIPLNANGKVDRKALPRPGPLEAGSNYNAPRDQMEEKLVELWSLVLGVEQGKIGIDHNFFHLGGQSLKLFMLTAMIHKEFEVKAPMSKFFEISSIRGQAQYIKTAAPDKYTAIDPVEKKDYYPMSPAQKRMYILQVINPDSTNYNMPLFTTLEGPLKKARLENAFRELIHRHESLRTSFHLVKSRPVQRVWNKVNLEIKYDEGPAAAEIIKNFIRPFDLSRAPILRVGLIKTGEENHVLLVDMHHTISDGKSLRIFLAELLALYWGKKLPELRLQYKDFSEWLENPVISDELRKHEMYWLNRLADLPVLKLPTDYPRPEIKNFDGALVTFEIPRDTAEKLRALAQREEVTMFMVVLTIFNILLFKLGRQEDIIVGTLVAGRTHPDLEYIIGMFVNTLVLRNYPGDDKNFNEFLKEVKIRTLEAFDYQDYPFDDLVAKLGVKRDAARNPLFDVLFLFDSLSTNEQNKIEIPGLKIKPYEEGAFQAKFDLLFTGKDSGESGNLFFTVKYSTELFKKETIERFINYFKEIVSVVIENEAMALKDIGITHGLAVVAPDLNLREESGFNF